LTEAHEQILIFLVALHSIIIGTVFFIAPNWTVQFGGWEQIDPVFFAFQAGAFHFALAAAYLIEYGRYRGIAILVTAKMIALVFLVATALLTSVPWAVPVSGLGDGAMAAVVVLVHRRVRSG
jgi:hypothetical protein